MGYQGGFIENSRRYGKSQVFLDTLASSCYAWDMAYRSDADIRNAELAFSLGNHNDSLMRSYLHLADEFERQRALAANDRANAAREQNRLRDIIHHLNEDVSDLREVNASLVDDLLFTQDQYATLVTASEAMVRVMDGAQRCDIYPALRSLMTALEGEPNDTQRSRSRSSVIPACPTGGECCHVHTHHGSTEAA